MSEILLTVSDIGKLLGFSSTTVTTWCNVYDTPEPDFIVGTGEHVIRAWRQSKMPEWVTWHKKHLETRNNSKVRHVWKR